MYNGAPTGLLSVQKAEVSFLCEEIPGLWISKTMFSHFLV